MALASDMALVQRPRVSSPLQLNYGRVRVGHGGDHLVITEPVENAFDEEFFDAMTNVFGDDRPVHLPGRF